MGEPSQVADMIDLGIATKSLSGKIGDGLEDMGWIIFIGYSRDRGKHESKLEVSFRRPTEVDTDFFCREVIGGCYVFEGIRGHKWGEGHAYGLSRLGPRGLFEQDSLTLKDVKTRLVLRANTDNNKRVYEKFGALIDKNSLE
ncbi:unnamed protein product [Dovyalis caffra]|uniref:Uncharacterized protein n=1 Tax=Dovyalis caffra TaxID=77055 RepID=A0AAV1RP04_9ROSI|nr:unnamed protein product [Dovyalis caffra]